MADIPNTQLPELCLNQAGITEVVRIGNDVCMTESPDFGMHFPHEFRVSDYMVMYVREGILRGKTNNQPTEFAAPAVIILLPQDIQSFESVSDDFKGCLITYSKEFSQSLNLLHQFMLNVALREQASMQLDAEGQQVMQDYYTQLHRIASFNDNPFQREAALHMTRAFFYGMGCYFYNAKNKHINTRQNEITDMFLSLVEQYGAHERRLDFYAEKMHLSSKYIASVVQKETGRTVSQWVEQAVLKEAKRLLTDTGLTVQQIAQQLQFRDQAYFGAYFKRLTGMSPKKYRIAEN